MRVAISSLLALALFTTAGCGDDDTGSGGTDDDPLTFPTQTRTASLSFATGDEKYLVTVWSTPGISEAAPSSDVTFELAAAGATQGLRFANVQKKNVAATTDGYWKARIAYENERRATIERWAVSAKASGAPYVKSEALRAAVCAEDGCTQQYQFAGQSRTFNYVGTIDSDVKVTVLTDSSVSASTLTAVAGDFAIAAKKDLQVMGPSGHTGDLDIDDSGTVTVVFTDDFGSLSSDIVGVFVVGDALASGSEANGNHADILWARTPSASTPDALIVGTLAHEYQHLVSFALRSSLGDPVASKEVLWLDEGLAHLMEDLTGWGGSTVDAMALALENWNNSPFAGPEDTVPQRGKAYTLLRYLVDQRAKSIGASDASDSDVLTAAHDIIAPLYTQTRAGFTHALFQNARSSGGVRDWLRAVYATNNEDVTQTVTASFLATASSPESNGQLIGFDPFAEYTTARDASVQLAGPDTEDVDDGVASSISDSVEVSGAHYYIVTGGEGTVSLTLTADDSSDVNVDAIQVN